MPTQAKEGGEAKRKKEKDWKEAGDGAKVCDDDIAMWVLYYTLLMKSNIVS